MAKWITENVKDEFNRPFRARNMKDAVKRIYERQSEAYERCGFFDPALQHGGPRAERRSRRSEMADVFDDAELESMMRGGGGAVLDVRLSDDPSEAFKQIQESDSKVTCSVFVRETGNLSNPTMQTGYRKWIARYLQECAGERKNEVHDKRLKRIFSRIREFYFQRI